MQDLRILRLLLETTKARKHNKKQKQKYEISICNMSKNTTQKNPENFFGALMCVKNQN
jgi:hypothetical protein